MPLVICADDYGLSEGTSAVIRALLEAGEINATTCLVETEAWPRASIPLRALTQKRSGLAVGLHLNLTESFPHCIDRDAIRPESWWLTRSWFAGAAVRARVLRSFLAQWEMFAAAIGRAPDFLDGHQYVHLFPPARRALLDLARVKNFKGWIRQCRTSSARLIAPRILYDPLSTTLARDATASRLATNSGFGGLRSFHRDEDPIALWRTDLRAMQGNGLLVVHPGADDSPPGSSGIDACRVDEANAFKRGDMRRLLAELGLSLR